MDAHYLAPLFAPRAIVVFAGSAASGSSHIAGGEAQPDAEATPHATALLQALKAQRFSGTLQFVSTQTRGTLADLMQIKADMALIALPPAEVPAAIELAARMACKAVMVLSSGVDAELAATWHKQARREGLYLLGPNCLGFQRPALGLNASILGPLAESGPLALVSQSGSLTASMLDWAARNAVSFSSVVSLGPHASVGLAEALDYLANDPQTQSILVYMEGIRDARRFMSALRSAANAKPVIVLKAGRHSAGQAAARTHSAAMVGDDEVFDAALRRAGAVRVKSFDEMFSAAKCLASRFRPTGKRLAIVTNGGGPGVLAADRVNDIDLALGQLSADTAQALKAALPATASLVDLIDLSEDATPAHFKAALDAANRDSAIDGLLAIYSPKPGADPLAFAQAVAECRPSLSKPLLTCWMGDATVAEARVALNDAHIPTYRTPESAVGAFGYLSSFYQNQKLLQQTPPPLSTLAKPDIEGARLVIESVLAERRKVLTEMESKPAVGLPHPRDRDHPGAQRARGHDDRHADGLPRGVENRLARHLAQIRCAGRGAQHPERHRGARHLQRHHGAREARAARGPHQRRDGAEDGAHPLGPRNLHRAGHRRCLRPGDHLWRWRHHDRADRRPGHGTAPAQPVPGPPADRARPRGRHIG